MFRSSGKTAAEFSRDNDLSPATLSFWLRQPSAPTSSEDDAEPNGGFFEVPLVGAPSPPSTPAVIVHLPNGVRLELTTAADATWVGQLVRTLASASA
jgi:hypothetical protein